MCLPWVLNCLLGLLFGFRVGSAVFVLHWGSQLPCGPTSRAFSIPVHPWGDLGGFGALVKM